jgi:hypothetical protein
MRRFIGWRTASLLVALPLALCLYAAAQWWDSTAIVFPAPPRSHSVRLAPAARPVFTHSVIPGGAYSSEELRDVLRRDAVIAAHYRDADLGQMRLTTLSKGKAAYVSYRVGDKIYWTRNRVWIPPGESVLTDGTVEIRARCGNCISDTRGTVAAVEPASGVLDESVIPPTDDARVAGFAAVAEPDLGELLTIPFGPQAFASFAPQVPGTPGDNGAQLWPQPPPFFAVPPGGLPGGSPGPDNPGDVPGNGPSPPPAPFVPGGGGPPGSPTSGGSTSGSSSGATTGASGGTTGGSTGGTSGGTTSGTPGPTTTSGASTTGTSTTGTSSGTPTTGTSGDTTTSGPASTTTTGSATTGWPTTGATDTTSGIVTTNGSPTSGVSGSTDTGHPPEAPEANLLWLVALGALGLASRRFRRWR